MAMSHFVTKLFNYISRLQGLSDTSQSLNRKVFTRFYDDESSIKIRNITFDKVLNILRSERLNFKQIDLKLVLPLTNHSPLTRNINYSFFFFICSFLDFAGEITLSLFVDRGGRGGGGGVAQSVDCATPDEEVPGSIPAVADRSLLVGSVSV